MQRQYRDSAETVEIKLSSRNLAAMMRSVDYMFICRDMVVQFNIDIHDNDYNCICCARLY